jgi:hypothetical protein
MGIVEVLDHEIWIKLDQNPARILRANKDIKNTFPRIKRTCLRTFVTKKRGIILLEIKGGLISLIACQFNKTVYPINCH